MALPSDVVRNSPDPLLLDDDTPDVTHKESGKENAESKKKRKPTKGKNSTNPAPHNKRVGDGGAGGPSGSGGAGSSLGGSGGNSTGGTGRGGTKRAADSSHDGPSKRGRLVKRAITIVPEAMHLAFNCPEEYLKSPGFSHFAAIANRVLEEKVPLPPLPMPGVNSTSSATVLIPGSATQAATVTNIGVILTKKIRRSESTTGIVWSGKMFLEGLMPPHDDALSVVAKIADWERESADGGYSEEPQSSKDGKLILKEAKFYARIARTASDAQITPKFYGVFSYAGTIALLLDHGGERLQAFSDLTISQKIQLFEKARKLHDTGIEHGELYPRNVLKDSDGIVRIVDFRTAETHTCRNGCQELKNLREDLRLEG